MMHAMGWVGVTEAQLISASIHVLAALFGPQIFLFQIGPLRFNQIFVYLQIALGLFVTLNSMKTVFTHTKAKKMDALLQLLPLLGVICCGLIWAATVKDVAMNNVYRRHSLLTGLLLGILFTHLSNQIIVCALCHMPYPKQWILLPLPLVLAYDYFGWGASSADVVFGVYLGAVLLRIGQFIFNFIEEITNFLGIYCLTLGPRQEPASLKAR